MPTRGIVGRSTGKRCQNCYTGDKGKQYVKNAVGMHFCLSEYKKGELRRKLAAFILQGREALFVHTLAALSEKYGYTVIAHEHDGLVTLEEIPHAAVEEAQNLTGMPEVRLLEKPFEHHPAMNLGGIPPSPYPLVLEPCPCGTSPTSRIHWSSPLRLGAPVSSLPWCQSYLAS
ncbi:hypothetical protein Mtai_v1c18260 [Meiothermus taiwanensis WR-220]|uniref:Uncharacterized protein n=1 Tax=Meiothermus taiwanensis WR-220 TaxID=1339250 RepID=A0ABM6WJ68_9DEIN|nr:hypothetical protein Mtai_v1c18260 [Meiothermus taiwanensis WR-220]